MVLQTAHTGRGSYKEQIIVAPPNFSWNHIIQELKNMSPEWAERILSWRHTGFNVRVRTKLEAERVGKYMVRPILALDRLLFLDRECKVGYRWGREAAELESLDFLVKDHQIFTLSGYR